MFLYNLYYENSYLIFRKLKIRISLSLSLSLSLQNLISHMQSLLALKGLDPSILIQIWRHFVKILGKVGTIIFILSYHFIFRPFTNLDHF